MDFNELSFEERIGLEAHCHGARVARSQRASLAFATPDDAPHMAYHDVGASSLAMTRLILAPRKS